jgi:hypothetical protein
MAENKPKGSKPNTSAINAEQKPPELSDAQKKAVSSFKEIVGQVNRIAAQPKFRKAISVLNHRTPFIEATIQLPAFDSGDGAIAQDYNWDMFEIPYNNIDGLELKNESGLFEVELKFSDNSFVFARNLLLKIQAIAQSGDFGGTPIIRLRWGWSETGLNKTPKSNVQPIISNVLFFNLHKITADTDLTKESYTIGGPALESTSGPHGKKWKPFDFFGPQPLIDFAWDKYYTEIKEFHKNVHGGNNPLADIKLLDLKISNAIDDKKEDTLFKGKSGSDVEKFLNKLRTEYGVENAQTLRKIMSGVYALKKENFSEQLNTTIQSSKISKAGEDFVILSNENLTNDQDDIFIKMAAASPKSMLNVIQKGIENKDIKEMIDQLFPVIGELNVNAYDALCHALSGMLKQNLIMNESFPRNKNKIFFFNFIPTNLIEDIKGRKTDKDPIKDKIKVGSLNCSKYDSWTTLLNKIASYITIAPGKSDIVKAPAKTTNKTKAESNKSSEVQNTKKLSFVFKTYNKELNKTDIEKIKNVLQLVYETSSIAAEESNKGKIERIGKKVTEEINRVVNDGLYDNITFIIICDKNADGLFNENNWGNKIFQTYSTKPLKKKGEVIFNSGAVKMSDEGFPDVLSFKPQMDFKTIIDSLVKSSSSTRSTKNGGMTIAEENDKEKAAKKKAELDAKNKKPATTPAADTEKSSEAEKISRDTAMQSVNINELRDISIPLNTTEAMVGDAMIDFKRKETNMRKQFASQMNNTTTADLVIFGEPAWDDVVVRSSPYIYLKHYLPQGNLSEYSGIWRVKGVTHSIMNGKFTTNLKISKELMLNADPFNNSSIMKDNISITGTK